MFRSKSIVIFEVIDPSRVRRDGSVILSYISGFALMAGMNCMANQPLVWQDDTVLSRDARVEVTVTAVSEMPASEVEFVRSTVQDAAKLVLFGTEKQYEINIKITRYDEGTAMLRCMSAGLGSMYLDAVITVSEGIPPAVIKIGILKKNYTAGGILGYAATMRDDITSKIAEDVYEAILKSSR